MRFVSDPGFVGRVYKATAIVAAVFVLPIAGWFGWLSVLNFVFGVGLGLGLLRLFELMADRVLAGGAQKGRSVLAIAGMVKYIVIAAGLYVLAVNGWMRPLFLVAGYALTHLVIVLKVIGGLIVKRTGDGRSAGPSRAPMPPGEA